MIPYFLFFIINIIILLFGSLNKNNKYKKVLLFFLFSNIIIFSSLRWEVGHDWQGYYNYFKDLTQNDFYFFDGVNWGYSILNYIFSIFQNYNIFLFFYTLISLTLLYKFIDFFSHNIYLSFTIYLIQYFLVLGLGQLRQGLAIAIVVYSFIFYFKKKYSLFLLFNLIAFSFHGASIIFLLFPIVDRFINFKKNTIILVTSFTLILGQTNIIKNIITNFMQKLNYDAFYINRIKIYLNSIYGESIETYLGLFERLLILILIIYFINKLDNKEILLSKLYFLGANIYFLLFQIGIFAGRFGVFFKFVDIVLIPSLIIKFKVDKNLKRILIFIYILIITIRLFSQFITYPQVYLPYKFFWERF